MTINSQGGGSEWLLRDRYIKNRAINNSSLFDVYEINDSRDDMVELTKKIDGYSCVSEKVIELLSECANSKKDDFLHNFKVLFEVLTERIKFEDTILEKRISPRINVKVKLSLDIKGKNTFTGTSINISETGCIFRIGCHVGNVSVGDMGLLRIYPSNICKDLPCKIARLTEDCIAVQFLGIIPEAMITQLKSI